MGKPSLTTGVAALCRAILHRVAMHVPAQHFDAVVQWPSKILPFLHTPMFLNWKDVRSMSATIACRGTDTTGGSQEARAPGHEAGRATCAPRAATTTSPTARIASKVLMNNHRQYN